MEIVCSDGDFAIASGNDGHQMLGATIVNPKITRCIFGKIFSFFHFFPLYVIVHYSWISQFGKISPRKKMLLPSC
jgi:hypothetical protein